MNTFQHEEDKIEYKFLSACVKKFNNEFLHRGIGNLRSRQNETLNALRFCWRQLLFIETERNVSDFFLSENPR